MRLLASMFREEPNAQRDVSIVDEEIRSRVLRHRGVFVTYMFISSCILFAST